jgi:DNA-binding MarR family transcriptional regulator
MAAGIRSRTGRLIVDLPSGFDPVLHPPARLQIAAVLGRVSEVEFARLKEIVRVSDSVLSKHLAALAATGHIKMRKAAQDGRQRTWVSLTRSGRTALKAHVRALQAIAAIAAE